jgi:ABC-type uncharacterized transport system permease subunit
MSAATAEVSHEAPLAVVSPAERRRYARITTILSVAAILQLWMWVETASGDFTFRIQTETAEQDQIDVSFDGPALGLICLIVTVAGLALFAAAPVLRDRLPAARRFQRGPLFVLLAVLAGLAFITGFCVWVYSGQSLDPPLAMTNPLEGTLRFATPLALGAMAGAMCERAGVINIAIEGQFLVGAFFASVVATMTSSAYVGLLGGIGAGVALAALLALFAIRYLANQIIVGVVLVVFAGGTTGFLLDQIPDDKILDLNSPPILEPIEIPGLSSLPVVGDAVFAQNFLVYLMYASVPVAWFLLFRTRWGLRVRAVGEHPRAADTVGIRVRGRRWQAVLAGGVFAGLGGAFYTVGSTGAFDKNASAGTGFIALAALIMGRWHPVGAFLAALFFGFVSQMQTQLQILQKIPTELLSMTPYLATVIAVAGLIGGRAKPPAADGQPYEKA